MTTTATFSPDLVLDSAGLELPPGYYIDPATGAWMTLPWPGDRLLAWNDPRRLALLPPSLGPGVIRWAESRLLHHLTGQPWRYTPGQKRFLIMWYSLRPDLRWVFRSGVKRGAKGTGKDPFFAAWALTELCGPVHPVGWDDDGKPVAEKHRMALVQIAANSEAQAKDVLRVANGMISRELWEEHGFDPGETRTALSDGSRLELLTASEKSSEGDPATAVGLNETHHMTESSGGHRTTEVARRNVAKSPRYIGARNIEFTNAHLPGADSTAEKSFNAWQAQVGGRTRRQDILYDSIEAPPDVDLTDEESLWRGLLAAYMDSPWSDLERLRDEILDLRTDPADSIRYYLNGLAEANEAWINPRQFDSLTRADIVVGDGERIAMFLDCSKSDDSTGLVGSRISDGHVMTLGVWQRPHGDRGKGWLAPREEVDAAVRRACDRYEVVWFGADPSPARDDEDEHSYWMPMLDALHRDLRDRVKVWASPGLHGHAVLFDLRLSALGGLERLRLFTEAAEQTAKDIDEDATLTHDGDPALRLHTHAAFRKPNKFGVSLGKMTRDSARKVDLAVCMVGARMGRRIALNSGKLIDPEPKKRPGHVRGWG